MSISSIFRWEGDSGSTGSVGGGDHGQFASGKHPNAPCTGGGGGGSGGDGSSVPGPLVEGSGGGGAGGYGSDGGDGCSRQPMAPYIPDPNTPNTYSRSGLVGCGGNEGYTDMAADCTFNHCTLPWDHNNPDCAGGAYGAPSSWEIVCCIGPSLVDTDKTIYNSPCRPSTSCISDSRAAFLKKTRGGGGGGCGVGTDPSTGTSGGSGGGVGLYGTGDPSIAKFGVGGAGPVAGVSGGGGGQGAAGGADGATGAKACSAAGFGNPQYSGGSYGGGGAGSPGLNGGGFDWKTGLKSGHLIYRASDNKFFRSTSNTDDGSQKTCAMPGGQGAVRIVWGGKSFPDNAH